MTAFYRDVVGLSVLATDGARVLLGAGDEPLLVLTEEPSAPARSRAGAGLFHTAFRVPDRAALGDALGRVRDQWRLHGASDHLVSEALYLADPEGNGVEIYRDHPRAEWPTDETGGVQMDTVGLDLDALAADAGGLADAPPGTDVGHVHLEVSGLAAARSFYVDALGMAVRQTWGADALFVAAGDYHHHVGLNTWHNRRTPLAGRGLAWFEVVLPDRAALDAATDRFAEAGVGVSDPPGAVAVVDSPNGTAGTDRSAGLTVTDPDDITLHLTVR